MAETVEGTTTEKEMSPVEKAIAAAKLAEANAASTAVATGNEGGTGTAVAATIPGKKMTMAELMVGSMSVDGWLKVNEDGLKVGDGPLLVDPIHFYIDFTEGVGYYPKNSIKAGNPAQYWSTFDNVTCASGGSWAEATAKARSIDSKAREYRAADIIFVVKEDIVSPKDKKVVLASAGQQLGHTTSTTNWANFEKLYKEVVAQGLENKLVEVIVSSQERSNPAGNKWGVLQFEVVGEVAQEENGD